MGRKSKHTKLSHAAHIKRHTEGTSNELSFSVLDAAKNAADAGEGKDAKAKMPRFGGIPVFTLPGAKKPPATPSKDEALALSSREPLPATSQLPAAKPAIPEVSRKPYEPPVDEIARRKTRRRIRNGLAITAVAAVLIALVGTGATFLYKEHTARNERLSHLDSALADLTAADAIIVNMDDIVTVEMTSETAGSVPEVEAKLSDAAALLDASEASVQAAESDANLAEEKEAVIRARASIASKREMIEQGPILMDTAVTAKRASDIVAPAWASVIKADSLARDAAALIADTTMENVEASKQLSIEANELFVEALGQVREAADTYPSADLSAQIEYIEMRIAAMGYAVASDDAILAYNKEEAAVQNDAYNEVDQKAAELAKTLSDNPSELIRSAYLRDIDEASKRYNDAKATAATADAFIRDYLGSKGK